MVLDFKEIPQANKGDGLQDTFELFARDFLEYIGFKIIQHPDRGPDGKKDLIVEEKIAGVATEKSIRWLVSCKHYAHKGASVKDADEINISERLNQHNCQGFIGFYSTLPSSGLSGLLSRLPYQIVFDHEKIESMLLKDLEGQKLASRYFPVSIKNYLIENPEPAKIFSGECEIICEYCNKNLLTEESGIYVLMKEQENIDDIDYFHQENHHYEKIYFACKGNCDDTCRDRYQRVGLRDAGWNDIDDLKNPFLWIQRNMAFFNSLKDGETYSDEAFEKIKKLFINTYPLISRHPTSKENERLQQLMRYGMIY